MLSDGGISPGDGESLECVSSSWCCEIDMDGRTNPFDDDAAQVLTAEHESSVRVGLVLLASSHFYLPKTPRFKFIPATLPNLPP